MRIMPNRRVSSLVLLSVLACTPEERADVHAVSPRARRAVEDAFLLGNGQDGALTVTTANTEVNRYAQLAAATTAGATTLTLTSGGSQFAANDLVLILQTSGINPVPPSGTSGPFDLSTTTVGQYELARVASRASNTLTVSAALTHAYPANTTQVVLVPEYTTVTISAAGSIRAAAWNGAVGGVVAFLAQGTVANSGRIHADARGFRGGTGDDDATNNGCDGLDLADGLAGEKGEGLAPASFGTTYARGNITHGGGGGVCHNSGGGGGGNGSAGAMGGRSWTGDTLNGTTGARDVGGLGGAALSFTPLNRLTFGGGAGAGHANDANAGSGGNGGGLVFIRAAAIAGNGRIAANGGNGGSTTNDGAGGGGGGGTILVRTTGNIACAGIDATGGNGGDAVYNQAHGTGGGGGGGNVVVQGANVTCPINVSAGASGASNGSSHGAGAAATAVPRTMGLIPETTIVTGPAARTNSPSASFDFTSDDPGVGFECSLDGSSYTACTDPSVLVDVTEGQHTLRVRARNALNFEDDTPASHTWTVDLTAPQTILDGTPPALDNDRDATFTFSANEAGATFECQLDGSGFSLCASSVDLTDLAVGSHTFEVRAIDDVGNVDASPASHTWRVNAFPTASNDMASVMEDASTSIAVLTNDSGLTDTPITVTIVDSPSTGTAMVNMDKTIRFTPPAEFNGQARFTYRVTDLDGDASDATVTVTVTAADDTPLAMDDTSSVMEDGSVAVTVLSNDSGLGDAPVAVSVLAAPASGTAVANADNTLTFSPAPDASGVFTFTYSVTDADGDSASATVTVTVFPVNDVPSAMPDSVTLDEDAATTITVLANDTGLGDAPVGVTVIAGPALGAALVQGDSTIRYTPTENANGSDSFTYEIRDADGERSQASVSISITAINDAPVAADDVVTTDTNTPVTIRALDNDRDPENDTLTISMVSAPANGSAMVNGDSTITYTPAAAFSGTDAFTYAVSDGQGGTSAGTVTVNVGEDSDGDGLTDIQEGMRGTDPNAPDSDEDGILDGAEVHVTRTDPRDDDTDDDGVMDGNEDLDRDGVLDIGETSALLNDSDGDGVLDGTELGLTTPQGDGTDANDFIADRDPSTVTNPRAEDSDGDGLDDGVEDANHDGALGPRETDAADADSDDDGARDGAEPSPLVDSDGDGLINARDPDSDDDGLLDGTELGVAGADPHTDIARGTFLPDADPTTTTDPLRPDTDNGGLSDGAEDHNRNGRIDVDERDPNNAADDVGAIDTDNDGLSDIHEQSLGTNPNDADTDDDGVADGSEPNPALDADGDGLINALDPDSDNDGLFDGTELGVTAAGPGTAVGAGRFIPDADPVTTTSPLLADSDGGGRVDGAEDVNRDGAEDAGETDPRDPADDRTLGDNDGDGLPNTLELTIGSDPDDADTDDDGVSDGLELDPGLDSDGDGLINARDPDSDNDGLFDGTELGVTAPASGTDLGPGHFVPDSDSTTRTSPVLADTDGGGIIDGQEDANRNGRVDGGETDPNNGADDMPPMDADGDGVPDSVEIVIGTDPMDADSDDDGVPDGDEPNHASDTDGDGRINALDPDSDNDGLLDGTEFGVTTAPAATDVARGRFIPDTDPSTTTSPLRADTDGGGVTDGSEDSNRNGAVDGGELNPRDPADDAQRMDRDADGLSDAAEVGLGTNPDDADSDDDGVIDGNEPDPSVDTDGDGLINARDPDSDNDGLFDGTEMAVTTPPAGTDVARGTFVADADPSTSTSPLLADTDAGGVADGVEDANHNGRVDALEIDPNDGDDDVWVDDPDRDGLDTSAEEALGTDPGSADTDGDGLTDGEEVQAGTPGSYDAGVDTSPLSADTDGGGVGDGTERTNGTNALDPTDDGTPESDPDRDGLTNDEESTLGTDPLRRDTDGDRLSDGAEIMAGDPKVFEPGSDTDPRDADTDDGGVNDGTERQRGTNPLNPADDGAPQSDPDNDGLTNEEEAALGTDANRWDTDGDRLSDGHEVRGGTPAVLDDGVDTNPLHPDTDGGGIDDGREVTHGTNPLDPSDDGVGGSSSSSGGPGSGSSGIGGSSSSSGDIGSSSGGASSNGSSSGSAVETSSSGSVGAVDGGTILNPHDHDGDGFPDDTIAGSSCLGCTSSGGADAALTVLFLAGVFGVMRRRSRGSAGGS